MCPTINKKEIKSNTREEKDIVLFNQLTQIRHDRDACWAAETGTGGTMTPGPKDFRGPIKITLKSEQRSLLCKQRADIIITL